MQVLPVKYRKKLAKDYGLQHIISINKHYSPTDMDGGEYKSIYRIVDRDKLATIDDERIIDTLCYMDDLDPDAYYMGVGRYFCYNARVVITKYFVTIGKGWGYDC